MKLTGIIAADFVNYRLPSLFLASTTCDWKCCLESGEDISVCQNAPMATAPIIEISDEDIYAAFAGNTITKAVVIGGLEPFLQFEEIDALISYFRKMGEYCDFVIYTGYYPDEIGNSLTALARHGNIVVKFGRYIPHCDPIFDDVLGVTLASPNQYAMWIS